jgi:hypothetical protein
MLKSNCPSCGNERTYKTKQGWLNGLSKNCKSCANSIKNGGVGMALCARGCGRPKDTSGSYSDSYCASCGKDVAAHYTREYRFRKYGVTRDWYERECLNGCGICGTPLNPDSKIKRERGHIDHDHDTGLARGVLCDLCNKGLGQFKDSIDNLLKAVAYLRNNKKNKT